MTVKELLETYAQPIGWVRIYDTKKTCVYRNIKQNTLKSKLINREVETWNVDLKRVLCINIT